VLIVVHTGRHGGVVIVPLGLGDGAVSVLVAKGGEELCEHLVGGHLAANHLGVHAAVVNGLEVTGLNTFTTIAVELDESSVNSLLADLNRGSADADEELIEVDVAVLVGVEAVE
jgi:hypothetical protein